MPSEWPNNAYITSAKHVGGGGGSPFHSVKHIRDGVYSPVSKIEVFAEDWKITGIKLSFANGTAGQMHGTRGQYSSQFDLQGLAGELVTKATVWPTEKKDRLAQIYLKTNRNREWYGSPKNWWPQFPQNVDVGSGLLVGVGGRCGSNIDRMGLVFLSGEWPPNENENFTLPKYVGGGGGGPFESTKWSGKKGYAPVSKIEVFSTDWMITGIRLTFTNGTADKMYGKQDKYYSHFSFKAGELVTKATIWPSEHNNRLSQYVRADSWVSTSVYIKTDKNREWYGANHNWWDRNPQEVEVGSGLLIGVGGRCGSNIDRMGLVFLRSAVKKITIDDFKYKDVNAWERPDTLGGLSSQVIARTKYSNNGPANAPVIDWKFGSSMTRTSTTTFNQNTLTAYGTSVHVAISSQVLRIGVKATGTGFEWQKTGQRTRAHSESQNDIIGWEHISGQLKVGEFVVCQAVICEGSVVLDYNARVTITFADANIKVTYQEDGVLSQTCWSQAEVAATLSTP